MSHSTKAVGNWFLERFWREEKPCTQLQLNKLVYIAHGWHLACSMEHDGLIDDKVIAWKYGPVIPTLREEFNQYGSSPIIELASAWGSTCWYTPSLFDINDRADGWELELLDWVWCKYGHLSGGMLIDITHKPGTPWANVTSNGNDVGFNREIPKHLICEYYEGLLEQLKQGKQ